MRGVDEGPEGTALVTGASRGLGLAVALELADRGFPVIATMRDTTAGDQVLAAAAERGVAERVSVQRLDVTDHATIAALELPEDLAILVNNAGWEGPRTPAEHLGVDLLRQAFETNVVGPAELTRRVLPLMRANGAGIICDVTSLARITPQPHLSAYRASKAARAAMLESLWGEVLPFGIRVVEVLPGPVETDMLGRTRAASAIEQPPPYDELARRFLERRMSQPDDAPDPACGLSVNARSTSPAEAARRVVEAMFDLDGPLRYGCEPLSERVLDRWRTMEDQEFMLSALGAFGVELPASTAR